jgi:hypothetical protein
MMMLRRRRLSATTALLLIAAPHVLIACSPSRAEIAPDPRVWSPVACADCVKAGVTIETRRSVDEKGDVGRYVLARVSNLNAHTVIFDLDLIADRVPSGDPDFIRKGWRVTLAPAGSASAATTLPVSFETIARATVSSVERL